MRAVPVPHYVNSSWSFAVTVQSDVVSWSDWHLQHWSNDLVLTVRNNSWNTNTMVKAVRNVRSVTAHLQQVQVSAQCNNNENVHKLLTNLEELPKRTTRRMCSMSMCEDGMRIKRQRNRSISSMQALLRLLRKYSSNWPVKWNIFFCGCFRVV